MLFCVEKNKETRVLMSVSYRNDTCEAESAPKAKGPFFKCRLGLPVVLKVIGIVSMKSIDMYILHDISLGVCFAKRSRIASEQEGAIVDWQHGPVSVHSDMVIVGAVVKATEQGRV